MFMNPPLQQTSLLTINNLSRIHQASCHSALGSYAHHHLCPSDPPHPHLSFSLQRSPLSKGLCPSSQLNTLLSQSVAILSKFNMQN